ncbi:hypothetical protein CLOSTMETH_00265 [[Clostridium] methylpentosum DSM 5476]|uniref:Uncharacterized protein n=1 Tax=[Clostridium] methylpentosum DSM 5476 TaxID=537013 RepID=C0E8X0_9FIRM|nr:hypothetical protein CLOSTMETH_00265 [[Clostridium] methylpentosum DSM 5476]
MENVDFPAFAGGKVEEGEALPEYVDFVDKFTGRKHCFPPVLRCQKER